MEYKELFDKLNVDKEVLKANGMTIYELFMLILLNDPYPILDGMIKKGFIFPAFINTGEVISAHNISLDNIFNIEIDKDKKLEVKEFIGKCFGHSSPYTPKQLRTLAETLIEKFPKGQKPGTNQYWRSSVTEVSNRLVIFFKQYGFVEFDKIIEATDTYIKNYENDNRFQQTLKYFILKKKDAGWESTLYNTINFHTEDDVWDGGGIELANK